MDYPFKTPVKKSGNHNPTKKISSTTIDSAFSHSAKGSIRVDKLKVELAQYLSGACFNPVPSSFLRAIRHNHFTYWPDLTGNLISKHLPKVEATVKGHLD